MYLIEWWIKSNNKIISSCYTYDINSDVWSKIADLNVARGFAACTVFEGKIVATGGYSYVHRELKSVEAYDYYERKWTYLPDMIKERCNHAAVSMGNKLFVIGGLDNSSCEVFDDFSRKFIKLNSEIKISNQKTIFLCIQHWKWYCGVSCRLLKNSCLLIQCW